MESSLPEQFTEIDKLRFEQLGNVEMMTNSQHVEEEVGRYVHIIHSLQPTGQANS